MINSVYLLIALLGITACNSSTDEAKIAGNSDVQEALASEALILLEELRLKVLSENQQGYSVENYTQSGAVNEAGRRFMLMEYEKSNIEYFNGEISRVADTLEFTPEEKEALRLSRKIFQIFKEELFLEDNTKVAVHYGNGVITVSFQRTDFENHYNNIFDLDQETESKISRLL